MLAARNRLRRSRQFREVVRRGERCAAAPVVMHYLASGRVTEVDQADHGFPLVGFVVPKKVGTSVQRNWVERRLRHLMRDRLDQLSAGDRVVVRALPGSYGKPTAELGLCLDRCLTRLVPKATVDA